MTEQEQENIASAPDLSAVVIPLLKGVLYQESDAGLWNSLLNLRSSDK